MPEPAPVTFAQLLPRSRRVTEAELLDGLLDELAPLPDRPRVLANFVSSADGRSSFQGRSGPLGDDGDHALFHGLRERVDAVLAGTTTLLAENYGRILGRAERRERRLARGASAEPLAVVVSRSGQVPVEIRMFDDPEARIALFVPREPEGLAGRRAEIELRVLGADELQPAPVMARLRSEFGVGTLLCEGGPTLFGSLLAAGLVDELFLTLAPKIVGGGTAASLAHAPEPPSLGQLRLAWLLERESSLFLRYLVQG